MLTKRRRQRKQQKKKIGIISNKNNFARAANLFCKFLCRCFARRQRETSRNFLVTRFMEAMLYVIMFAFFFAAALFYLGGRQHFSPFLTAAIKFSCYSSNEIGLLCFFISVSGSFSVIHANVDFQIKSKERIGFVVVVFYL